VLDADKIIDKKTINIIITIKPVFSVKKSNGK